MRELSISAMHQDAMVARRINQRKQLEQNHLSSPSILHPNNRASGTDEPQDAASQTGKLVLQLAPDFMELYATEKQIVYYGKEPKN